MRVEDEGAIYVACGNKAVAEAERSITSLRKHSNLRVAAIASQTLSCDVVVPLPPYPGTDEQRAKWAKVHLYDLSPFEHTLYLDADTRIYGDLSVGLKALEVGWELVIVPSPQQVGSTTLWHLTQVEKEVTLGELGIGCPVMLNTGVLFFRRSERLSQLFTEWKRQWLRFKDKDQGALLRALDRVPVSIWLLGRPFNGGEVVEHLFGRAR